MDESVPFCTMCHMGRSSLSRRQSLLAGAAAAAGAIGLAPRAAAQAVTPAADQDELSQEVITTFGRLPGQLNTEMARKLVLDEGIFCLSSPVFAPRTSPAWSRRARRWRR